MPHSVWKLFQPVDQDLTEYCDHCITHSGLQEGDTVIMNGSPAIVTSIPNRDYFSIRRLTALEHVKFLVVYFATIPIRWILRQVDRLLGRFE